MLTQNRTNPKSQGPAYREFSRRRYRELKEQAPNLRESEIVARVIREWDAMNMEQKNKLLDMKKDNLVMLNVQPLSTPMKSQMPAMKAKTNQKTTIQKKTQKMEMKEGSGSSGLEEINVREFDESSAQKVKKTKKIAVAKNKNNSQYILFFKSYFDRLLKEHPKWSARQITSIIKLLWKKRNQTQLQPAKKMRLAKRISGRLAFRKTKCLSGNQAKEMWKRLPLETKMFWNLKGNQRLSKTETSNSMQISRIVVQSNPTQMANQFNFINVKTI